MVADGVYTEAEADAIRSKAKWLTGLQEQDLLLYILAGNLSGEANELPPPIIPPIPNMPLGAVGMWYADEYSATPRPHVPNAMTASPVSANIYANSRRVFNNSEFWNKGGMTIVDYAATAPDGSNDASTASGTGGWFIGSGTNRSIPAGTYTVAVSAKRNAGTDQQFCFSQDNTATRSPVKVATSTWQRFSYTFTRASSLAINIILLCSIDGSTAANLQICDFELFAGSADLGPVILAGHLYLGDTAFDTRPSYSGGVIDLSTGGWGQVQFANNISTALCTTMALISKTAAGSSYQAWLSKVQNYGEFTAASDIGLSPYFGIGAIRSFNGPGLWQLLGQGYHLLTHRYNGVTGELWLDDLKLFTYTGTVPTIMIKDFLCGSVSSPALNSGFKLSSMALYERALSDKEIRDSYQSLRDRALDSGIATASGYRVFCAEGDSITEAGGSAPYLFGPNASPPILGNNFAISGSSIANLNSRAPMVDAVIPASPLAGQKFVLHVLLGANDLGGGGGTGLVAPFLTNLAAYLDARRAAGWKIVLGTILPGTGSGFNTNRNLANPTLRTWLGVHCDAIADFAADPTIGTDAAASNTTYYSDGQHPAAPCYVIMEPILRAAVNGLP